MTVIITSVLIHLAICYFFESTIKLLLSKYFSVSMILNCNRFVAVYTSCILHLCFQELSVWEVLKGIPRTRASKMKNILSNPEK